MPKLLLKELDYTTPLQYALTFQQVCSFSERNYSKDIEEYSIFPMQLEFSAP